MLESIGAFRNDSAGESYMLLHVSEFGQASDQPPLIILHGFLGSSDNWHTLARRLSDHHHVFTLDARNHGRSPHSEEFTYTAMANDVREFIEREDFASVNLLGHSMGGRTAMELATSYPDLVERLIVVDIAPKPYPPHHQTIFAALRAVDLSRAQNRSEVESALSLHIPSPDVRQFLLKNLRLAPSGGFFWKINLPVLEQNYAEMLKGLLPTHVFEHPTLFIRGAHAGYVLDVDILSIQEVFPCARISTLDAGHWVHAELPEEFIHEVLRFLDSSKI
jgi:esterase